MVKTHEIDLNASTFNQLVNNNYIILEIDNIEVNDYILFKEIEVVNNKKQYTELHQLTRVRDVINHEGLKGGYVLLSLDKIN